MIQHMSPELDQLAAALAKAQAQVKGAAKDSVNPQLRNKYADLASVWEACRDALTANGLAVSQHPGCDGVMATVDTILLHQSGQFISSRLTAPIIPQTYNREAPPMVTAQATIAAVTYLRRTALAAVVGVAPADDDGQEASGHSAGTPAPMPRPQSAPQQAPAPRPQAAPSSTPPGIDPVCPTCSGKMWDNRPKKASGEMNPKAPDFKCRDKSCQGLIWKHTEKAAGPVPSTREPLLDAPPPAEDDRGFPF